MMNMRERIARALTETLAHHGVTLHPDDVDGLALDALNTLREPDEAMLDAAYEPTRAAVAFKGDSFVSDYFSQPIWQAMIDAAKDGA